MLSKVVRRVCAAWSLQIAQERDALGAARREYNRREALRGLTEGLGSKSGLGSLNLVRGLAAGRGGVSRLKQ